MHIICAVAMVITCQCMPMYYNIHKHADSLHLSKRSSFPIFSYFMILFEVYYPGSSAHANHYIYNIYIYYICIYILYMYIYYYIYYICIYIYILYTMCTHHCRI